MSIAGLRDALARIATDPAFRARLEAEPAAARRAYDLTPGEIGVLLTAASRRFRCDAAGRGVADGEGCPCCAL
jgi:hypothetical protein